MVVYKSPLPTIWVQGDMQARDASHIEQLSLQRVSRESDNQVSDMRGTFVRPLEEAAFERHVKGLESY